MTLVIIICFVFFILFPIAIAYYWIKDSKEFNRNMETISSIGNRFKLIGKITPSSEEKKIASNDEGFITFNRIHRLFKYNSHHNYLWIEYSIRNTTEEELYFDIGKVFINVDDSKIECDVSLLLEFVPEYLAPPRGIRYFDTKSFNTFILGPRGQKEFRFESRFPLENNNFKKSDAIEIEAELKKIDLITNQLVSVKKLLFVESFKDILHDTIYTIDEQISWQS